MMTTNATSKRHRLPFVQTLAICGMVYLLYRIFRSPELDRQIGDYLQQEK
jgi:hypothetical protein